MTVGEFIYKIGFKTDPKSKSKAESEMGDLAAKAKSCWVLSALVFRSRAHLKPLRPA